MIGEEEASKFKTIPLWNYFCLICLNLRFERWESINVSFTSEILLRPPQFFNVTPSGSPPSVLQHRVQLTTQIQSEKRFKSTVRSVNLQLKEI